MQDKTENYLNLNRAAWDARVQHHLKSDFYNQQDFMAGKNSLNPIELALLGDLKGKKVLHLQCHFGQDSISLARLGAAVTAVDFSPEAISAGREIAKELAVELDFICCDVYELPKHLQETFDYVFTSYGVLGWLPDMQRWAEVVAHFLKPNGQLVLVEFHPIIWMFDDDFQLLTYRYFKSEAIIETYNGTYADREAPITVEEVSWNHALSEILGALLGKNLKIKVFQEFDYSPYGCFPGMEEVEASKFRFKRWGNRLPLLYALVAEKEG